MPWTIRVEKRAFKDLLKFSKADQKRITDFLDHKLALWENPREFGELLPVPLPAFGNIALVTIVPSRILSTPK